MAHAPLAAAPVVLPESAVAPNERVARDDEQVLQPLDALPGSAGRRKLGVRSSVPWGDSAVRRQVVVVGEVRDIDGDDEFGCRTWADAGHREEAAVRRVAVEEGRYLGVEGPTARRGGGCVKPVRVREVGERLDCGARSGQDAAQAVLVPGRAGGCMCPRCAAIDLVALSLGSSSGAGSRASGTPSAVFAMTIAFLASVLASPVNSFEASCAVNPSR